MVWDICIDVFFNSADSEFSSADAGDDEIDPFDSGVIVSTNPASDSGIDDVLSEAEGTTVINKASDTHCTCMHIQHRHEPHMHAHVHMYIQT